MRRIWSRGVALALALTIASATAAVAHPAFNPNQLPVGEAVDAVLVVPHGCDPDGGMPEDGASSPTVALDLQLAPEVTTFDAHELEGWQSERDGDVVRWVATDGGTTEPIQFPVTVAVDGPVDETIYLSAFQECEEGSFRWIGTPDREAEYPAVKLTPTQGEIGTEQPEEGHAGLDDDHDHTEGDGHGTEGEHASELDHGAEEPTATATEDDDEVAAADESGEATADTGVSWVVVAVVLLVLLVGAGSLWAWRRGGSG